MNTAEVKQNLLDGKLDLVVAAVPMAGSTLTVESRNLLMQACQAIADEKGFGKAVEIVIGLSRKLKFLLADPTVDALQTVLIPMESGATCRLEANPKRADRGNIKKLIELGIIDPAAPEESWMYELWPSGAKGTSAPLNDSNRGWAKKQPGATKCFLCSGLGEGRAKPVNPNEIFISCSGPAGAILAGCNFAALGPYHMTAFASASTQQRVDAATVDKTLTILENLRKGTDTSQPFTVIHNGDLVCNIDAEGKVSMKGVGATLLHDHNQFMRAQLPIASARTLDSVGADGVSTAVVDWPSSVVRVEAPAANRAAFLAAANKVIAAWQARNADNTVNLILTSRGDNYVLFVAMRRLGMVDAPGKKCVASLEQSGIVVLDEMDVFAKYQAATPAERLDYVNMVLQGIDPIFADVAGDVAKQRAATKELL